MPTNTGTSERAYPFQLTHLIGLILEAQIAHPNPDATAAVVDFLLHDRIRRARSWQRWLDFCQSAQGPMPGDSIKDLLDDQYRRA